ncbi:MAG: RND family transporter [Candidatus Binatia bacterium]
MTVQRALFSLIMRHKVLVVLLFSVLTAFLGYFAVHVKFDNSIESYFLARDLRSYHRFLAAFGTDEIVVVAFGAEDVFTPQNFKLIDAISRKLATLPHVRRVLSLTTAKIVFGKGAAVVFEPLTADLPARPQQLAAVRRRALADPVIPGTLVSPDARNTAIVAEIDHLIGQFDYKVELLAQIRTFLAKQAAGTGRIFRLGGTSVLDDALFRYTRLDQLRFFPIMIIIIIAVMCLMFRRLTTSLLPFVVVIVAAIWTYGFMSLLGYKINVVSTILGPLLLAVGIADSMHIIAEYLQESTGSRTRRELGIERAFCTLLAPCVMTSATTILGLLSLLGASLVPVRQFGLVAAVGVLAALLLTILLLPILLAAVPPGASQRHTRPGTGGFTGLLTWLGTWDRRRATWTLLACLVAIGPAAYSLSRLTVGTNSLDYFRQDDPVRRDTEWIDRKIGGTTSLEFLIDAGAEDALIQPAVLERMERFQNYLRHVPGVTNVYAPTTVVKTLNQAFHGGDPSAFRIPHSAAAIAQELLLVDGSAELQALLSDDRRVGRITARVAMNASRELAHSLPQVEARMQQIFGRTVTVTPTGLVYLMHRMEHYLLSSQIKSFALAFVVITLVMMGALRSWQLGLVAMIPNLLPILFVLALMPLLDIPLDVGTVMIAGVALGLVVDDTIHFLYRVREHVQQTRDARRALALAMRGCGRPIVFTSIVLSLGFSVLVLASFNPVIHFGILASVVILLALVFDLVVLPAALGFTL